MSASTHSATTNPQVLRIAAFGATPYREDLGARMVDQVDQEDHAQHDLPLRKRSKRGPVTAVACEACQKRKSKCDGGRPMCSICRSKHLSVCVYEAEVDSSRMQQLRNQNRHLRDEVAVLQTRLCLFETGRSPSKRQEGACGWRAKLSSSPEQDSDASENTDHPQDNPSTLIQEMEGSDRVDKSIAKDRPPGFGSEDQSLSLSGNAPPGHSLDQLEQSQNLSLPIHFIQPSAKRHDSPISKVYSSFRDFARQAIADGEPAGRILGSFEVNTGVILSNSNFETASLLSQWAGQVVSAWGIQSLAPKIGMMYMLFRLMRWQVSSSQSDFSDVPEMMKPSITQLCIPHPPFIDFLLWPSLRDLLISESQIDQPLEWVEQVAQTIDLARCFTLDEVLYGDPLTGHFRIKEAFRLYIENIDHWTLDQKVSDLIPRLKGTIKFR